MEKPQIMTYITQNNRLTAPEASAILGSLGPIVCE